MFTKLNNLGIRIFPNFFFVIEKLKKRCVLSLKKLLEITFKKIFMAIIR